MKNILKMASNDSVLITGADRGLGLGFVKHYLACGKDVVATSRRVEQSESLTQLRTTFPQQLTVMSLDVGEDASIEQFSNSLNALSKTFSLVINNAGISVERAFGQWTVDMFERHFLINTIGPAILSQALVPWIAEKGKLIQITSGMASLDLNINPQNSLDAYAASKCALNSLSQRMAAKVKGKHICVVMLNPGWVKTEMGGDDAPTSVEQAILKMTSRIELINIQNTGTFIEADGTLIPW